MASTKTVLELTEGVFTPRSLIALVGGMIVSETNQSFYQSIHWNPHTRIISVVPTLISEDENEFMKMDFLIQFMRQDEGDNTMSIDQLLDSPLRKAMDVDSTLARISFHNAHSFVTLNPFTGSPEDGSAQHARILSHVITEFERSQKAYGTTAPISYRWKHNDEPRWHSDTLIPFIEMSDTLATEGA